MTTFLSFFFLVASCLARYEDILFSRTVQPNTPFICDPCILHPLLKHIYARTLSSPLYPLVDLASSAKGDTLRREPQIVLFPRP